MAFTRFEIHPAPTGQFHIFNVETQTFNRSRFHTEEAAHEWVLQQTVNHMFSQGTMPGRHSAPRMTSNDYSGDNERTIRRGQGES